MQHLSGCHGTEATVFLQHLGATKEVNRHSNMLTASTTPFCRFFHSSWRSWSGSPIIWRKSWICQTLETSGALKTWTTFLLAALFQTDGAITCTPFTPLSSNLIVWRSHAGAVLSVRHGPASLSWQKCGGVSIAYAFLLRCDISCICIVYDWYVLVLFKK